MIKIVDDLIAIDELFGPLPNFEEPFESYFLKKAADLLTNVACEKENPEDEEEKFNYIVRKFLCLIY